MTQDWNQLLQFAASRGYRDLVALALNEGAAVDTVFDDGKPALFYAARGGHLGVVQLLIMRGALVGALSAFTAASEEGHGGVVRELNRLAVAELESTRAGGKPGNAGQSNFEVPGIRPVEG